VRLTVRDTGRGMDASALLEAFDPFSTNRNTAGRTGLGLLCVNAIVQQARGVLDVDSSLGVGTEFSIYFPRAISRTVTPVTSPLQFVERNPVVSENANTTVLVVDDEPAVRTLVRLILEGRGFKVLDARDGHDALLLAEIQRTPIDLLVADIAMPEMDGVELAKQLRGQFPDLRVLFMSGYMTESLVARDSVPTHEALVQKPFAIATLLAAIGNILGVELTA
jgi:CheY-like chemotaxis protein